MTSNRISSSLRRWLLKRNACLIISVRRERQCRLPTWRRRHVPAEPVNSADEVSQQQADSGRGVQYFSDAPTVPRWQCADENQEDIIIEAPTVQL